MEMVTNSEKGPGGRPHLVLESTLAPGNYGVRASLIYDLNLYNDRAFTDDQTQIDQSVRSIAVP